jgi:hypothetical protein
MIKTISLLLLFSVFLTACDNENGTSSDDGTRKPDSPVVKIQTVNPYADVDLSPMDISYFPVDYPKLKMADSIKTPPVMRLIYSRPHKQGRKIFGNIVKYGQPWRMGANETSEIEFFQPVTIQDKKVNVGRYMIYCIPDSTEWTIILNSNVYTWGLRIDSTKDIMRFMIPTEKASVNFEYLTMVFRYATGGAELVMAWDDVQARLRVNF